MFLCKGIVDFCSFKILMVRLRFFLRKWKFLYREGQFCPYLFFKCFLYVKKEGDIFPHSVTQLLVNNTEMCIFAFKDRSELNNFCRVKWHHIIIHLPVMLYYSGEME